MNRAILYAGRAIIALDLGWLLFSFATFVHLERFNAVEAVFFEYLFSFFHFVALVTMLYLTERKHEDSHTDYRLLNLDWKNTPLIVIPLFTDVVALTRSIRSTHAEFASLLIGLSAYALCVTALAVLWFVVAVALTRCRPAPEAEAEYEELAPSTVRSHSLKRQ